MEIGTQKRKQQVDDDDDDKVSLSSFVLPKDYRFNLIFKQTSIPAEGAKRPKGR